jgi:predicted  nucleic acid-binding Zn-ribbon protein
VGVLFRAIVARTRWSRHANDAAVSEQLRKSRSESRMAGAPVGGDPVRARTVVRQNGVVFTGDKPQVVRRAERRESRDRFETIAAQTPGKTVALQ